MDNLIGTKLGDFTILERIGQGGMATVYRAEQPSMKREVALKVISVIEASEHDNFFRRFEKEASLIASLENAHILPVHDYGIQGNWAYMAMRYLRGGSLKDALRKERLPLQRVLSIFEQIVSGLAYAHSKGIVHRDLKPANIMLDEAGNAYLTDFGLAKIVQGDSESTHSGSVVGTIAYISPEQLRGDPIDHRADIYSLGIILYEMAVGQTPFKSDRQTDIITRIYQRLEDDPEPPRVYGDIPLELEHTIMRAIDKRPDRRFDSVADMLIALESLMGKSSLSTVSLPAVSQSLLNRAHATNSVIQAQSQVSRRNKNPIFVSVVIIILMVVLLGVLLLASDILDLSPQPEIIPQHTVLQGVSATASEISLTVNQQERAQLKLDDEGFVAIIACNLSSEYHATLNREIRDFLIDIGIESRVYNADNDAYDQIPILEQTMAEGAVGIILCPLDYNLLDSPLQTVADNNMPFVLLTREENLYGGTQLSSDDDNYSMGYTVGQFAGEFFQDEIDDLAEVVILDFPEQQVIVERADGLEDGFLSVVRDAKIVGRYLGGFSENGRESIEELLDNDVDFNVILSINDAGSYGAIDALEEAGVTPEDVMIFSVDAERKAVDYMQEGRFIRGSLSVGRQESALAAAKIMTQMLAGEEVPESITVESGDMIVAESEDD